MLIWKAYGNFLSPGKINQDMSLHPRKWASMEGRSGSKYSLCPKIGMWKAAGLRANGAADNEDRGTSAVQEPMHLQGPGKATPAPGKLWGMVGERDNPLCKHLALTSVTSSLDINVFRHQLGASWSILMAATTLFRPYQPSGYFWPRFWRHCLRGGFTRVKWQSSNTESTSP